MPTRTTASETSHEQPAGTEPGERLASTSKKTGSRKRWIQPPSGGKPTTMPASAAGTARMTSGTVMILGDSWMWCCTSGVGAVLAPEGEEDEAEHVDGRQEGRDDADDPHDVVAAA